jgi:polysaccharide export outer membrane protein
MTAALLWFAAASAGDLTTAQPRDILGPGDSVRVTVFRNPELTTEARLSERGTIVLPLAGEMELSGLTPAQAGARIAEQLRRGEFIVNPQVTVAVLEVRSRHVTVLGQVNRPGKFPLDDTSAKLIDVLALAGGIGPSGADTVMILTRRSEPQIHEIDVAAMMRTGDLSANMKIENGDMVFVPRAPVFYIYGEVQRAGAYRLEPKMTVAQALALGGGVTPRGTVRGLSLHRRMPDGSNARLEAGLGDLVQPDDVIYVRESLF